MTDDMDPRAQRLRDMVAIVLDAVSRAPGDRANDAVDAQAIVNAFHYITAAMLEATPDLTTPAKMRLAAEAQSKIMLGFMKELRVQFERTGVHGWDVLNVPERKLH